MMFHSSSIAISRTALRRNLRFLKHHIGQASMFSSVIKGNAYGHGIETFLPLAEECGVRHFSVYSADEALCALQSRTQDSEIMIMGHIDHEELAWAVENRVSFYVFDTDRLEHACEAATRIGVPARIHLEIETGMNRTGLDQEQIGLAIRYIKTKSDKFEIAGVCTHFAGAESAANRLRVQEQLTHYRETTVWLQQQGVPLGRRHAASSAATLRYRETLLDMVRVGIAQYGFWPNPETRLQYSLIKDLSAKHHFVDPLSRVMRWTSRIMSIKHVRPGEYVGYGTHYLVMRPQKIAAIPIGYYHGFSRDLSNLGYVLVRSRRAPVVGLVNMTMIMVDVTDCPGVQVGDEVVIIGRQNRAAITVQSFSEMTRNVNYEVLVRIPRDIPRVVVD
jgi:alanine racemase